MIIIDIKYNTVFYDSIYGGDPIFYQHIFWFFGHPEVYILVMPSFNIITSLIIEIQNTIIFGTISMIVAISTITYLGTFVWSHHMFVIGIELDSKAYFMTSTLIISIPTATKIYNWIITNTNTIFKVIINKYKITNNNQITIIKIKIFLIIFTIGGNTGLIIGNNIIDISIHDSYYVVAHFHTVLALASSITSILGINKYHKLQITSTT